MKNNNSTICAHTVVSVLASMGVEDVVIAPGSRNAPLIYAFSEYARQDFFDLHVRIDERSAGFLALGIAKASNNVVAIITTSGTAVANLFPAVLEAHHSRIPLLVLSADRPHEMRGIGANQTTSQYGMFGFASRLDLDIPAFCGEEKILADIAGRVKRAVVASLGVRSGYPGPAHLNVAFREPLTPDLDTSLPNIKVESLLVVGRDGSMSRSERFDAEYIKYSQKSYSESLEENSQKRSIYLESQASPSQSSFAYQSRDTIFFLEKKGCEFKNTVIVAGDRSPESILRYAQKNSLPILAEPSSGVRVQPNAIGMYQLVLPYFRNNIERVIVCGKPTLTRAISSILSDSGIEIWVVDTSGADWEDVSNRASLVVFSVEQLPNCGSFVEESLCHEGLSQNYAHSKKEWLESWQKKDLEVSSVVENKLKQRDSLSGIHVVQQVWNIAFNIVPRETLQEQKIPTKSLDCSTDISSPSEKINFKENSSLIVGASNVIRDLDFVANATGVASLDNIKVFANRGLAGIDGTISTAIGVALARGGVTRVIVGDITFLHDIGGLLVGKFEQEPQLQIMVVNDWGGAIFKRLEHGTLGKTLQYKPTVDRFFTTPHEADIAKLAAGYGVHYDRVFDLEDLSRCLKYPQKGISIVEVVVDEEEAQDLYRDLKDIVV